MLAQQCSDLLFDLIGSCIDNLIVEDDSGIPISGVLDNSNADMIEPGVENVGAVRRRFHPLFLNAVSAVAHSHVFSD